ncbi:MAG: deoxyribodipyrimidine photo-lyase [Burkholderiales bacterium]|nr:MAG: deoxyribodipyrimidine photo-lyase [Burkholderiales bacterium]
MSHSDPSGASDASDASEASEASEASDASEAVSGSSASNASRRDRPDDLGLVWLRRDLRLEDHAALHRALAQCRRVYLAFVFDRDILDPLPERADRRVEFIHASLAQLDAELRQAGTRLVVCQGRAVEEIPALAAALGVEAVFIARDYEPAAVARDREVAARLRADGRRLVACKDQVVYERDEVLTAAGRPFSVFTPYRNAWRRRLSEADLAPLDTDWRAAARAGALPMPAGPGTAAGTLPSLAALGFEPTNLAELPIQPGPNGALQAFDDFRDRIGAYAEARDFPALRGPSYLSVHLRFGTISIRALARYAHRVAEADPKAAAGARSWLDELIWRDFYFQILHHHPHVVESAFKPEYDRIVWENAPQLLEAWCRGRTGYPLVDAAMAQINGTGYMHNRLRMVVASFLVKDLGIDWRAGERYFAQHLNDFDLSANNGGWQWAASTGCDAQPYFRIFNPVTQSRRFDPDGRFIRRYLPQLAELPDKLIHAPWQAPPEALARAGVRLGENYPRPVVDHDQARRRTLERYAVVKRP